MRIGVDLLGSESSPKTLYHAVLMAAEYMDDSDTMVIYLTREILESIQVNPEEVLDPRVDIHLVTQSIASDEVPLAAMRSKQDSSLVVGVRHLSEGKVDAFVSAGNTGALIATTIRLLPSFPGVECPALLALLPTEKGPLAMIDVGGIVTCQPVHLVQFAHMAAAFQRCRLGVEVPTVGLLNIGEESAKGKVEVREAYRLLQEESALPGAKINFVGNVEGREVFQGKVDVLVTDGFSGNVMLKTAEGVSSFILDHFASALQGIPSEEVQNALEEMRRHFSYDEYPGAVVCGVEGVVVKCHGAASEQGFLHSILGAMDLVKGGFLNNMRDEFPLG